MNNIINNTIELLSPAGSFECAKVAIDAGADAIYMGGAKFGARAFAKSVEENSIVDAIKYTKEKGKKFYLTVNTLFKQKELKEIFLFLDDIVSVGVDAFIVQDLGVSMMLKERYKNVELHASTQMTITSSKAINLVKSLGFTQVVLARELSIKEIKAIKKEIGDDIKLEAFVHGSMCYSYSGACLMSSFIGKESGNRGRCKGPCRLPYKVVKMKNVSVNVNRTFHGDEQNRRGERPSAHEASLPSEVRQSALGVLCEPAPYLLSMKDMCALNSLQGLINAGVTSFKIEGRMRQADYVAGVTKTYRKYIDTIVNSAGTDTIHPNVVAKLAVGAKLASPRRGDAAPERLRSELDERSATKCPWGASPLSIENDEKYLLALYNKGGFTNYYDKHNGTDMIQKYERK